MSSVSKKPILNVFIEASIVGILLVFFVKFCDKYIVPLLYVPNKYITYEMELYIVSGFLFHFVCEYTGLNLWYAKDYCKLI